MHTFELFWLMNKLSPPGLYIKVNLNMLPEVFHHFWLSIKSTKETFYTSALSIQW